MVSRLPLVRVSGRQRQMPSGDAVPVAAGGTGAVTAAAARANLVALNAALPSLRNRLINGAMSINQRTFGGGALAAGAYGYDRWKAGSGGANLSVSAAGVISHSSGSIVQVIEAANASDLAGGSVTVSVEDGSGSLTVALAFAATDTTQVTGTISGGLGRRSVTLTLPSGTGNLTLTLTASSITYKRVQLEAGAVATGWDARPYALEFLMCKYYCFRMQRGSVFASATTRGIVIATYEPMRVSPSAIATAPLCISDTTNDYYQSTGGIAAAYLSTTGGTIYFDTFSGLTVRQIYIHHATQGGAIILDAEL